MASGIMGNSIWQLVSDSDAMTWLVLFVLLALSIICRRLLMSPALRGSAPSAGISGWCMWSAMAKALRRRDRSTVPSPLATRGAVALLIAPAMTLSAPQILGSPSTIAGKSFATFAMLDLLCHSEPAAQLSSSCINDG